jgi:L,D-transpeptidase ErfK/SrfK
MLNHPLRIVQSSVASLIACFLFAPVSLTQTEMLSKSQLAGNAQTYQVAKGDTLYGIARRFGLAYPAIGQANGIHNPNMLRLGKSLILPTQYILPAFREDGIIVNLPELRLYFFRSGNLQAVYPVAVGLPTWQTPTGPFTVMNRLENPAWYMPPDLARRENIKREIIKAGPDNPLGDFWIGTSISHTGIHGTNVPMTIGRPLSHGCVRMYPEDIKILFDAISKGEQGEVLYEPVKATINGDDILVEAHPDVYEKIPDMFKHAENKLRALGVLGKVDRKQLADIVGAAQGIPVSVLMK